MLEPEFFSVETYATAFAEFSTATTSKAVVADSSAIVPAENDDAAPIDFELHDELLASLF